MWGSAVTIDASPERTIKAGKAPSRSSESMRANPRPCEIRKESDSPGERTGSDFELGHLLGRGGMGVVYAARQASLDREIAVKMIDSVAADDPDSVSKFLSEAVVTGNLDHPNIVPVYDVGGTRDGTVFYAMKEVSGNAWDESIAKLPLNDNLRILLSVCDAVAFAHDKEIIHRDLKPENVMLGSYGEILVMDWGLALHLEGETTDALTEDSGLAGTPSYMAPEMANCCIERIGSASDIYLLGGILYEIVTGLKPHTGHNVFASISAAMENHIAPTDKKGELVDIALKAMSTEPADRHASVKNFQRAIREYQEHAESLSISSACNDRLSQLETADTESLYREANEIIAGYQQALNLWPGNRTAVTGLCNARTAYVRIALERGDLTLAASQLSALESESEEHNCGESVASAVAGLRSDLSRARARAAAKERLTHISTAVAVIGALAVIAVTAAAYLMTRNQRDAALEARAAESVQRKEAQGALNVAEEANYYNLIALADRDISQAKPGNAEKLLLRAPARLRGWEWGAMAYLCRRSLITVRGNFSPICCAAFDSTGKLMVTADFENNVTTWNTWTGKPLASIASGVDGIFAVAIRPSDGSVLVVTHDGHVRAWNTQTVREVSLARLDAFRRDLIAVSISPDSRHIAGLARDGQVSIWSASTAALASTTGLRGSVDTVGSIAVSADLKQMAAGSSDGAVRIYNMESGAVSRTLTPDKPCIPVVSIALSRDGRHVAVGTSSRLARIWDLQTGEAVLTMGGHDASVSAIAFAADGRRIVTADSSKAVRIWDARNAREFLALRSHAKPVTAVAFSPDGSLAATGSADSTVRIWNVREWRTTRTLRDHDGPVTHVGFDSTGTRVLTAGQDGTAKTWDAGSGKMLRSLAKHDGPVASAAFSPDGARILTTDSTSAKIWDAVTGKRIGTLQGKPGAFRVALFSPDGRTMLTAGNSIAVWDTQSGKTLASVTAPGGAVRSAAFSPDGARFITGDRSAGRIWSTSGCAELQVLEGHAGAISCVAFSPDGKRALTGSLQGAVLWNAENGRELLSLTEHQGWVTSAAFSPDGRYLLTGGNDSTARLRVALDWNRDIESLQEWKQELYRIWSQADAH